MVMNPGSWEDALAKRASLPVYLPFIIEWRELRTGGEENATKNRDGPLRHDAPKRRIKGRTQRRTQFRPEDL
jgi:hypothetical protein